MFDVPMGLLLSTAILGLRGAAAVVAWLVAVAVTFAVILVRSGHPSAGVPRATLVPARRGRADQSCLSSDLSVTSTRRSCAQPVSSVPVASSEPRVVTASCG